MTTCTDDEGPLRTSTNLTAGPLCALQVSYEGMPFHRQEGALESISRQMRQRVRRTQFGLPSIEYQSVLVVKGLAAAFILRPHASVSRLRKPRERHRPARKVFTNR